MGFGLRWNPWRSTFHQWSVDLGATADITSLNEVFDFAKDYLGLLKSAVIASGIVPPGIEGSGQNLSDLLARVVGPGRGLELVSNVNNIPKGSRLAVSTNLLAALISVCMRATRQAQSLEGSLQALEEDHDWLLQGGVFTPDLIETWLAYKYENEVDPIRMRPHPHEFHMYFDA